MIVFSSYAMQVIMSFLMLAMIFMMLPRAQVSAKRINEVLDTKLSIEDGVSDILPTEIGTVEFKMYHLSILMHKSTYLKIYHLKQIGERQ